MYGLSFKKRSPFVSTYLTQDKTHTLDCMNDAWNDLFNDTLNTFYLRLCHMWCLEEYVWKDRYSLRAMQQMIIIIIIIIIIIKCPTNMFGENSKGVLLYPVWSVTQILIIITIIIIIIIIIIKLIN